MYVALITLLYPEGKDEHHPQCRLSITIQLVQFTTTLDRWQPELVLSVFFPSNDGSRDSFFADPPSMSRGEALNGKTGSTQWQLSTTYLSFQRLEPRELSAFLVKDQHRWTCRTTTCRHVPSASTTASVGIQFQTGNSGSHCSWRRCNEKRRGRR